jgi:hypothetical protein
LFLEPVPADTTAAARRAPARPAGRRP